MDLNKAMIIGRVAQDPDVRTTPTGQSVTNFTVVTNRVWKDSKGEKQEKPEFHNVVAWRKLAELCGQYLFKGKQVYIEGHLQTRTWEGRDGAKRSTTEIVTDSMILLSSPRNAVQGGVPSELKQKQAAPAGAGKQAPSANKKENKKESSEEEINIEDIPF